MADANVRSRHLVDLTRTLGTQRLDVMGLLGKGSFATVFSCKTSEDRRDVAVKIEREVRPGIGVLALHVHLDKSNVLFSHGCSSMLFS